MQTFKRSGFFSTVSASLALLVLNIIAARTAAATAIVPTGPLYTVGFEDWVGTGSDRDFNDTVFTISGVAFHTTGTWTQPVPAMYPLETPFPYATGFYFDTTVATGNVVSAFLFQQSSAVETVYIQVGAGGLWTPVTSLTPMTLSASVGDQVSFKLLVNGTDLLYPDAAGNPDGLPHAIEATHSPEPGSVVLLFGGGVGLLLTGLYRRRSAR